MYHTRTNMNKNKDIKIKILNEHVGESCIFLGRIIRKTLISCERNDQQNNPFLINSLYMMTEEGWKFISHTWIELPKEFENCLNYVIQFDGEVYSYEHTNGPEGYGIEFKNLHFCKQWEETYYHGLRMYTLESKHEDRNIRRKVNNNLSIIFAYENGEDLDYRHNYKGKKKEYTKRKIQVHDAYSNGNVFESFNESIPKIEQTIESKQKVVTNIDELCDAFSNLFTKNENFQNNKNEVVLMNQEKQCKEYNTNKSKTIRISTKHIKGNHNRKRTAGILSIKDCKIIGNA